MTKKSQESDDEVIAGVVEHVAFHSEDSGFCVLRSKVRGVRQPVTIVGRAASVAPGEWLTANGSWENDRNYGQQFRARFMRLSPPTTTDGIERYFASGMVRGIGQVYARKLVRAFGDRLFDIIETEPWRLRDIAGIGPKRVERIVEAWAEQKAVREIMVFLHSHGVGATRAIRIYKTYGADALQIMSENPYRLAHDIRGIGFTTADTIAMKLGIRPDAMVRLRAGVNYGLSEAAGEGHCGLPLEELVSVTAELLECSESLIREALDLELAEGRVVADRVGDDDCVFPAGLHHAETGIARMLARLLQHPPPWRAIDAGKAIPWFEERTGLELAASQKEAVGQALAAKVMVITGGPGVGKTTIVNTILAILAFRRVTVLLAAPTGRAAKRMSEATGMEAKTIHRLLEFDPGSGGFRRNAENPLECTLLVVDEMSMVDVPLMHALLQALSPETALLAVGDVDQLPSVGPGRVLGDMIASGSVPVARLHEVFRQAAQSRIVMNAHRVNDGIMPDLDAPDGASDFYFVPADDPAIAVDRIVKMVSNRIPKRFGADPVRDIQVLCPMNRGAIGAVSLNVELQRALNPQRASTIEKFGRSFAPGDKVMQIENDYDREVYNGDIGHVDHVLPEEGTVTVAFDGRLVIYTPADLDALVPAYAVTIHKSQGSEYPIVIIPILTQHYAMLRRNLLYTGITRGSRLVVLVGQHKAIAIAVRNRSDNRRWTRLAIQLKSDNCQDNAG